MQETSPTVVKKPLGTVKSTPNVKAAEENGDENLPPEATVVDGSSDPAPENKDEDKPVEDLTEQVRINGRYCIVSYNQSYIFLNNGIMVEGKF